MATTEKPLSQVIDLTGPQDFTYLEVLTDAGIVRVNVGLVKTSNRHPSVVVEIDYNQEGIGRIRTPAGGDWDTEVRGDHVIGNRIEVALTRRP